MYGRGGKRHSGDFARMGAAAIRTIKTPAGLAQWRNSDNLQRGGLIRPHRMAKRLTRRGILVAGKDRNGHGYVLADRSGRYPPTEWARVAISLYGSHAADRIVAERNNGGDMVEATIRMVNPNVPVTTVWASRGKIVRAEPVAALYEQNKIHHVGTFATLEDQMCGFTSDFDRATAGYSPDRVDALVWALTDLLVEPMANSGVFELYREQARQLALEQCQARTEAGVCAGQPRVTRNNSRERGAPSTCLLVCSQRTALPHCRLRQSQARSDRSPRAAANPSLPETSAGHIVHRY